MVDLAEISLKIQGWAAIKLEAPDLAEFLKKLNAQFGKPAGILVQLQGVKLIDQGSLDARLNFWNGKLRPLSF